MATAVDIVVNVVTRLKDSGVEQAQSKFGRMGSGLKKAMVPAVAAIGVIGAFGAAAVESASRLEQAVGATDSVFGRNAAAVKRWSDDSATAVGLAKSEYLELSNVLGAQLKNMGLPMKKVAGQTKDLVTLGADLSATFGGTTADAVEALSSLMRGESDPIEKYGVSINQAAIAAEMAAEGTDKLKGKQAKAAKTQALLTLLTKQTADAQGGFARETDTAAHAQQVASASYEDAKAALGEALLPAITKVMAALSKFARWAQENPGKIQAVIVVILALAAAVIVLNVAMLILSANPIVLIIAGIVAVVILLTAAVVLLVRRFGGFKAVGTATMNAIKSAFNSAKQAIIAAWNAILNAGKAAFNWIRNNWKTILAILTGPIGIAVALIVRHWDTIVGAAQRMLDGIKHAFSKVGAFFSGLGSRIKGLIGDASKWLYSVGTSIMSGLLAGLDAGFQWVRDKVEALGKLIPGWLKKKLGIASPSKVTKEIGRQVAQGLAAGMDEGRAGVADIAAKLADTVGNVLTKAFKKAGARKAALRAVTHAYADELAALRTNAAKREALAQRIDDEQKALEDLKSARDNYNASVRDSAIAYASILALPKPDEGQLSLADMLDGLKGRAADIATFNGLLATLKRKNVSQTIIDQLAQAGVEAGMATAQALADGDPAIVAAISATQDTIDKSAAALGTTAAGAMYDAGVKAQADLVRGLLADQKALEAAAETLATRLANAVAAALRKALKNAGKGGGGKSGKAAAPAVAAPALATYAATPRVPGRSAVTTAATMGGGVTINVSGAIDPESTARQIRRILDGHDRRVGLRVT